MYFYIRQRTERARWLTFVSGNSYVLCFWTKRFRITISSWRFWNREVLWHRGLVISQRTSLKISRGFMESHMVRQLWPKTSSMVWMRPSREVKASDCQCRSRNRPGFDPSILQCSGIWEAADEAVLNTVQVWAMGHEIIQYVLTLYISILKEEHKGTPCKLKKPRKT